jgi:hypothetical protein
MLDKIAYESFRTAVIILWSVLAVLTIGGAIWLYYRRKAA